MDPVDPSCFRGRKLICMCAALMMKLLLMRALMKKILRLTLLPYLLKFLSRLRGSLDILRDSLYEVN